MCAIPWHHEVKLSAFFFFFLQLTVPSFITICTKMSLSNRFFNYKLVPTNYNKINSKKTFRKSQIGVVTGVGVAFHTTRE